MQEIPERFEMEVVLSGAPRAGEAAGLPVEGKARGLCLSFSVLGIPKVASASVSVSGAGKGSLLPLKLWVPCWKWIYFPASVWVWFSWRRIFAGFLLLQRKGSLNLDRMSLFCQLLDLMSIWSSHRNLLNNAKICQLIPARNAWRNRELFLSVSWNEQMSAPLLRSCSASLTAR